MENENKRAAVGLISGGLDSTVVAAYMKQNFERNNFIFCDYGQKTLARERASFESLCDYYKPDRAEVVDMRWMRTLGKSALFDSETQLNYDNRKNEYVPFRNACLLAAAVALAETVVADAVLIGSTGGDTICPDNSPNFIEAFQAVIREGTMTENAIRIEAPLISLDKKGVILLGNSLGAPFELSWSCHNNIGKLACGECSNCVSRKNAFIELGSKDPISYE